MREIKDIIYKYEPLFESWSIDEKIGEGSLKVVYKASRKSLEKDN